MGSSTCSERSETKVALLSPTPGVSMSMGSSRRERYKLRPTSRPSTNWGRKITAGKARDLDERPQVIPRIGTYRIEFNAGPEGELRVGRRFDVHGRPRQQKVHVVRTGTRGVVEVGTLEFNVRTAGDASRSLSQRERAGGEGPYGVRLKPLTLTLSQRERGQESRTKKVI
jgi:hypothetical protein